ncbi:uncharacterized protein LOC117568562 isoform X2 [Drosophila albomicans]|uniref:Uncharacterized protein LOC117568562 isoform X2 n=1 Tax=Drosophila albomicans TaxID=7291 RepID=A0A9C6SXE5_DROAB|nr:uncharacterized protein LOC117568562 isoform X2 [Drosophila albomicans]
MEIKNILRIYHVFLNQSIGQDQYLTLMVILLENLQMLICLRRYFYRDSSNLYKPLITQLQYNICDLLRKSNARNFLEKYAMEHFRIYTNLNHTCPFSMKFPFLRYHFRNINCLLSLLKLIHRPF